MDKDDDTPVKDAVTTKPEDTQPVQDVPPVVTPPENASADVRDAISALKSQVDELSGIVTGILSSGGGPRDDTPVKKPWTHRGSWGGRS